MGKITKNKKFDKIFNVVGLLFFIFVVFPTSAINLKSFTAEDGLFQNSGTAFVIDHDGFLWIGTELGVSRFDGYEFKTYPIKTHNLKPAKYSYVNTLYVDGNNTIWAGLHVGIAKLDRSKNIFKVQASKRDTEVSEEAQTLIPFQPSAVIGIQKAPNQQLWIGHSTGLFVQDASGWHYDDAGLDEKEYLSAFTWIDSECLLIGTDLRIYRYCPKNEQIDTIYQSNEVFSNPKHYYVTSILKDGDNIAWIGIRYHGVYRLDLTTFKISKFKVDTPKFEQLETSIIIEDSNSNIWFGSYDSGTYRYNKDTKKLESISSQPTLSLMPSDNGTVWVGSYREGIQLYSPKLNRFAHLHPQTLSENSVQSNNVVATTVDSEGRIWAAISNEGALVFENGKVISHFTTSNGLLSNDLTVIRESPDKKIWLASFGGISIYDLKSKTFSYLTAEMSNMSFLKSSSFFELMFDKNGHVWLSKWKGGLYRVNGENVETFDNPYFISNYRYTDLLLDNNQDLWAIHESGVSLFDEQSKSFKHYLIPQQHQPLYAYTNFVSKDNKLYLVSRLGIYIFDLSTGVFENLNHPILVDDYTIYSAIQDGHHSFWFGTEKGLLNYSNGEIELYDLIDGIQGLEFNGKTSLAFGNGELLMGGVNGISIWNPDEFLLEPKVSEIVISESKLLTNEGAQDIPFTNKGIELNSSQRNFSITVSSLDYSFAEKIRYAYRIPGITDWVSLNQEREVSFIQFPHGQHTVELKSTNGVGYWNDDVTKIVIDIEVPFWKRWYFIAFCCLFILVLALATHRFRMKRLKERAILLETLVKERTNELQVKSDQLVKVTEEKENFFANISHEIKTPLTLILGPAESIMKSQKGLSDELSIIIRNSKRLLKLVNRLLSFTSLSQVNENNWSLTTSDTYGLDDYAADLSLLAREKQITLEFKGEITGCPLLPEDLETVMSNLVSNAIKYSPENTIVTVMCSSSDSEFTIEVVDQGISISSEELDNIFKRFYRVDTPEVKEQTGAGLGLSIVKSLAEKYSGSIIASKNRNNGSTFIFKCPMIGNEILEPISKRESPIKNIQSDQSQLPNNSERKTILVVDDNTDMRDYICSILSNQFDCLSASNALSAYQLAIDSVPDFIISDINMLPVDGFEFCRMLKDNQITSHIPIMMLTADGSESRKMKSLQLKANYFLTKPFSREELLLICQNTIANQASSSDKLQIELTSNLVIAEDIAVSQQSQNQDFINKLHELIDDYIMSNTLSVQALADALIMSKRQFQRKMKSLTGIAPLEYIRQYKLNKSLVLLKQGQPIKAVSFQLGFNSVAYFTKCFKDEFKVTPKEFVNSKVTIEDQG
ncbi:ATP-binding protein [Pleionea sediminis]|uniref:ATP-binding protein n=1 Tax=Pleionea sediminis TaxID=2569479 RepID=UPI001186EEE9|nr:ATP-binding protein [Pleionea sediminis]